MENLTKEETLKKLKERMQGSMKENQELEMVYFSTEDALSGRVGIPVTVRYKHKAKTGRVTTKKKEIMFFPMYDPFTGEEFKAK